MDSSTIVTPLSGVELTHLTYALVVVATFFGVSSLYLAVRVHRLNLIYKKMMQGATGESMEAMMLDRIQDIEELKKDIAKAKKDIDGLEAELDEWKTKYFEELGEKTELLARLRAIERRYKSDE